jgi:polyhydroxybutyrate depolymerase
VISVRQVVGLCALVASLSACKPAPPAAEAPPTTELKNYVFKHDGIVREVGIFDPRSTPIEASRPLVMVLHGGLGDDDDAVALSFGKLNQLASQDDFLVAYPSGVGGHWNDGRNVQRYVAQRERVHDVDFLSKLVDELVQKRNVDPNAVFFVGVSDGAMMAHRFACERTAKLKAFAAVIGSMPYNVVRRSGRCGKEPLSVLMINGTEDPIVPWEGGFVQFDGQKLGKVLSAERTFLFWMRHEGCKDVEVSMIPDFVPGDGTRIERRKAVGCRGTTKVELFAVQGAGHTWPSGWQYLPQSMVGTISKDIDAAVAVWRFFQSTL